MLLVSRGYPTWFLFLWLIAIGSGLVFWLIALPGWLRKRGPLRQFTTSAAGGSSEGWSTRGGIRYPVVGIGAVSVSSPLARVWIGEKECGSPQRRVF